MSAPAGKPIIRQTKESPMTLPKIHLFTGFLGTGKTTAIRSLIPQKPADEKWLIIVNEFGEIGIDGAVLSGSGIPVGEIAGGCLCCSAGGETAAVLDKMLAEHAPDRVLIEASGLAHAAGAIDELAAPQFAGRVQIAAAFALVDPRQFTDPDYAENPLYRDQISACDVLVATKTDLCNAETLAAFRDRAAKLFPAKALIAETEHAQMRLQWLDTPLIEKPRYRIKALPENSQGRQAQGYTFPPEQNFDLERLSRFFNDLPRLAQGLARAKGVFRVQDTWVWLNWAGNRWGATQTAWRRDSRFELIAGSFDADEIARRLRDAFADE